MYAWDQSEAEPEEARSPGRRGAMKLNGWCGIVEGTELMKSLDSY